MPNVLTLPDQTRPEKAVQKSTSTMQYRLGILDAMREYAIRGRYALSISPRFGYHSQPRNMAGMVAGTRYAADMLEFDAVAVVEAPSTFLVDNGRSTATLLIERVCGRKISIKRTNMRGRVTAIRQGRKNREEAYLVGGYTDEHMLLNIGLARSKAVVNHAVDSNRVAVKSCRNFSMLAQIVELFQGTADVFTMDPESMHVGEFNLASED